MVEPGVTRRERTNGRKWQEIAEKIAGEGEEGMKVEETEEARE